MCEYRSVYMAAEKERKINYIIRKELTYKLPHNTGKENGVEMSKVTEMTREKWIMDTFPDGEPG